LDYYDGFTYSSDLLAPDILLLLFILFNS